MQFEDVLKERAMKSLEIAGKILDGKEDVPMQQCKVALSMIGNKIKQESVVNSRARQVLGFMRDIRDLDTRTDIALSALRPLLPEGTLREPARIDGQNTISSGRLSQSATETGAGQTVAVAV